MQITPSPIPPRRWPVLLFAGTPALITLFLWATSPHELSLAAVFGGFVLSWIAWAAYQPWNRGDRRDLPLFAMLATMYWIGYGLPLFWGDHAMGLVTGFHVLSEDAITKAVYLAVIGVICLWAGMQVARKWRWAPDINLDVPKNPWRWSYLRFVLVAGALLKVLVPTPEADNQWRQIIVSMEAVVPTVAFVLLLRYYLQRKAIGIDKFLLAAYFVLALISGLSSGWLGSFVGLGIVCVAAYVLEKRRLPVVAMLVVLPVILFLQPGKAKFREKYWKSGVSQGYVASYGERVGYWMDASLQAWGNALSDPSGRGLRSLSGSTLARLSLLEPTANVIETTPSHMPYQGGRLYSYLLITFVPRFLWADKPSVSDANKWYQIAYHLTLPKDINNTGMAVGTVTESYISFGWIGPFLILPCLGFFLGVFQEIFLKSSSGLLLTSIGIALLPGLLAIESQMAVYIAGIAQQVVFAIAVLIPVLEYRVRSTYRLAPTSLPRRRVEQ